ncbi:MAG: Rid family hydrolase [Thermomicrobiales bacterium]
MYDSGTSTGGKRIAVRGGVWLQPVRSDRGSGGGGRNRACDPDPEVQAHRCLEIIVTALREAGAGPEHVVRTRMFITDAADADAVGRAHGAIFVDVRPASTMVVVAGLLDPRWKVEIEAEAIVD